ncbi:MAG: hypothetical protein H7321_08865, partial [Bacteroidia bacterium]|nr:hypothetical protein [Bacteroidia bacterium]
DTLKAKFYINPVARVDYSLIKNAVTLYTGTEGYYRKNSMKQLINTNPFLTGLQIKNQYTSFRFYGGVNAKLAPSTDFNFEMSTSTVSNLPLFITKNDSVNSMTVIYDNVRILKVGATLNFSLSEKIRAGLTGNFYDYKLSNEANAWHLPNAEFKVRFQYKIKEKIYIHTDIIGMGLRYNRFVKTPTSGPDQTIKGFADFNLGIDYRLKPNFSFFLNANNIGSSRYQRWYAYNVYGFNLVGGITATF